MRQNEIKEESNNNLEQLIVKLRNEDLNYARLSKVTQIVYWAFIPMYTIITGISLWESWDTNRLIGGICYILAFLIFAIFFGNYYKEYKYVDYSLPTIIMLKKAAYRYQPFQKKSVWIFLALILMDIGMSLNTSHLFSAYNTHIMFAGLIAVAIVAGYIFWVFKYKPLRDNALHLIKEIEGD